MTDAAQNSDEREWLNILDDAISDYAHYERVYPEGFYLCGINLREWLTNIKNYVESRSHCPKVSLEETIRDNIRDVSGGHSLTNLAGNKLWYAELPINITELEKAILNHLKQQGAQFDVTY